VSGHFVNDFRMARRATRTPHPGHSGPMKKSFGNPDESGAEETRAEPSSQVAGCGPKKQREEAIRELGPLTHHRVRAKSSEEDSRDDRQPPHAFLSMERSDPEALNGLGIRFLHAGQNFRRHSSFHRPYWVKALAEPARKPAAAKIGRPTNSLRGALLRRLLSGRALGGLR